MKKFTRLYSILLFIAAILAGCDIKKNKEVKPEKEFLKIYDDQSFSNSYIPVDLKQTSDGGYIILAKTRISASAFYGIYLLKADKQGNFVSQQLLPDYLVSPTNSLMQVGQDFYFFGMDGVTLESTLIKVDENGVATAVQQLSGILYPLSTSQDEAGNFVLQSYDRDNLQTMVSTVTPAGNIQNTASYDIGIGGFDAEQPIIDHLTGNGKALPFLSGSLGNGTYYFNGFYNYTFSLVFFNFGSTASPGVLQGYKDERCISSVLYLTDINKFALSGYAYGNNTIYSSATVAFNAGAVASSSDLTGFSIPEFNADARVILKQENLDGKNTLIYGSDTRSGQIALYFYEASTGNFLSSKHLGYSNTFQFGNMIKTTDGGLAIVGVTYLSGRFPRLCLYKISSDS
ncbi:MAG TPA: hypothetical protein VNB90_03155 [Cytophagaceae bacterium]|nr:hypothetical protein [Cytophagaceae bacterium]